MITSVPLARNSADTSVFVFETGQLVSLPTSAKDIVTELSLVDFRRHSKQFDTIGDTSIYMEYTYQSIYHLRLYSPLLGLGRFSLS
jgi:hypothetical protein